MVKPLTGKQEAFCAEYIANGGNASAAYRFAYSADKMKPNTVCVKASELLSSGNVSVRVAELKKTADKLASEEFTITVKQRLEWLKEITEAGLGDYLDAGGNKRRENLAAAKGAIETMNSMLGISEKGGDIKPVKVQVGVVDAS